MLTLEAWTEIVPVLVIVLELFPEVDTPWVLDVITPLLVMVTGAEPRAVTPVLDPPLIWPLLVSEPPFGITWGPTVTPAGMVVAEL